MRYLRLVSQSLCYALDRGFIQPSNYPRNIGVIVDNRELKKTTTAMATGMSLNKRFNEQNRISLRSLQNNNVK